MIYLDPPKSDRLEKWIRGICGTLLGLFVAFAIWTRAGPFGVIATVIVAAVSVIGCVVGAVRYGDAFWTGLLGRGRM